MITVERKLLEEIRDNLDSGLVNFAREQLDELLQEPIAKAPLPIAGATELTMKDIVIGKKYRIRSDVNLLPDYFGVEVEITDKKRTNILAKLLQNTRKHRAGQIVNIKPKYLEEIV